MGSLRAVVQQYLLETGNWEHVPGAPHLAWIDKRRKLVDGAGTPAVPIDEAVRRQLLYDEDDAFALG